MKIALIGDVHGNLPALEAVLADIRRRGTTRVWNIGDFVGYGPFPDEVVTLLRSQDAVTSIAGNYDIKTLDPARKKAKTPGKDIAFSWALEQLSKDNRRYLAGLATEARLEVAGRQVLLCHGSPVSVDEHLVPETPESRLRELAAIAKADIIIFGHSHVPFVKQVQGVWFINTGSVGRPDDGNPAACYAMLTIGPRTLSVKHYRLPYDVDRTVDAVRRHKLPETFAQMFIQGRSLSDVTSETQTSNVSRASRPRESTSDSADPLSAARELAKSMGYDQPHTDQVTKLALSLFDQLAPLHRLGGPQRLILELAAILHDIGWSRGGPGHHKASMAMIMEAHELPLEEPDRTMVACVARYHRKALPSKRHEPYASLDKESQKTVRMLAAILRIADGLDQSHVSRVQRIDAKLSDDTVTLDITARGPWKTEDTDAHAKADLFEMVFNRRLVTHWKRA